jgi:uncharacterized membrane protein
MSVLIILFGSLAIYRAVGALGVPQFLDWTTCARYALATMFVFTGLSHFTSMRKDFVAMVPPSLPNPELLVTLTGVLELAGAAGLLLDTTRTLAAYGLIALLIAMFPANWHAARQGLTLRGRPVTTLSIRVPMQLIFIVWAWWVS